MCLRYIRVTESGFRWWVRHEGGLSVVSGRNDREGILAECDRSIREGL